MNRHRGLSAIFRAFQQNEPLIKKVLRRFGLSPEDIADLTQETILRALEAERRQEIREPTGFLVGIAKNIARKELQKRSRFVLGLIEEFRPEEHILDEPSVDDVVDSQERMLIFWEALSTLPPQCQKVFVLKNVHGERHKDIAQRLGISVSTVEKHVAEGLKRAREFMQEKLRGESIISNTDDKLTDRKASSVASRD